MLNTDEMISDSLPRRSIWSTCRRRQELPQMNEQLYYSVIGLSIFDVLALRKSFILHVIIQIAPFPVEKPLNAHVVVSRGDLSAMNATGSLSHYIYI